MTQQWGVTPVGTRSPDGHWVWDGARWQPAAATPSWSAQPQPLVNLRSPDGRWTWDGAAWRPTGPALLTSWGAPAPLESVDPLAYWRSGDRATLVVSPPGTPLTLVPRAVGWAAAVMYMASGTASLIVGLRLAQPSLVVLAALLAVVGIVAAAEIELHVRYGAELRRRADAGDPSLGPIQLPTGVRVTSWSAETRAEPGGRITSNIAWVIGMLMIVGSGLFFFLSYETGHDSRAGVGIFGAWLLLMLLVMVTLSFTVVGFDPCAPPLRDHRYAAWREWASRAGAERHRTTLMARAAVRRLRAGGDATAAGLAAVAADRRRWRVMPTFVLGLMWIPAIVAVSNLPLAILMTVAATFAVQVAIQG